MSILKHNMFGDTSILLIFDDIVPLGARGEYWGWIN